jgi:hypothetical protein
MDISHLSGQQMSLLFRRKNYLLQVVVKIMQQLFGSIRNLNDPKRP